MCLICYLSLLLSLHSLNLSWCHAVHSCSLQSSNAVVAVMSERGCSESSSHGEPQVAWRGKRGDSMVMRYHSAVDDHSAISIRSGDHSASAADRLPSDSDRRTKVARYLHGERHDLPPAPKHMPRRGPSDRQKKEAKSTGRRLQDEEDRPKDMPRKGRSVRVPTLAEFRHHLPPRATAEFRRTVKKHRREKEQYERSRSTVKKHIAQYLRKDKNFLASEKTQGRVQGSIPVDAETYAVFKSSDFGATQPIGRPIPAPPDPPARYSHHGFGKPVHQKWRPRSPPPPVSTSSSSMDYIFKVSSSGVHYAVHAADQSPARTGSVASLVSRNTKCARGRARLVSRSTKCAREIGRASCRERV